MAEQDQTGPEIGTTSGAAGSGGTAFEAAASADGGTTDGESSGGGAETSGGGSFKDQAGNFARQAGDRARQFADTGKARAGDALDEVARLMEDAASTVEQKLGGQYGQYARSAAQGLGSFSEELKAKDIDQLIGEAQDFVRKSPAIAIGVAAALGFVIARVVKSGVDAASEPADGSGA